jgi:hypothetical protein
VTQLTDDQLELLKKLEFHGGVLHVVNAKYSDYERLEKLAAILVRFTPGGPS